MSNCCVLIGKLPKSSVILRKNVFLLLIFTVFNSNMFLSSQVTLILFFHTFCVSNQLNNHILPNSNQASAAGARCWGQLRPVEPPTRRPGLLRKRASSAPGRPVAETEKPAQKWFQCNQHRATFPARPAATATCNRFQSCCCPH